MRARYLLVCVLAGLAACATYGAVAGAAGALTGGGAAGPLLGVAFGALLGGLIVGAALGLVLGGVSGVVATLVARGTTQPQRAAVRVGVSVLVTFVALLALISGLGGSVLGGDVGWARPGLQQWVGVVVPSVLAAGVAAWAARSVADMTDGT